MELFALYFKTIIYCYHEYKKKIKKHMNEKKEAKENRKKFIEMEKIRKIIN